MTTVNIDIDQGTVTLRGAFPRLMNSRLGLGPIVASAGFGDMRPPGGVSTGRIRGNYNL